MGRGDACHTLRELEASADGSVRRNEVGRIGRSGPAAAVEFQPGDLPAGRNETIKDYLSRLLAGRPPVFRVLPSFPVGDPSREARPEVVQRLPRGPARILDVGCGAGGLGIARAGGTAWTLTGVERDPSQAARARQTGGYERVLEGDLAGVLPAARGGRSPVRRVRLRGRSRAPGGSRRRPDGGPGARRGECDAPRRGAQRRPSLRGARPAARPARSGSGRPLRRRAPALVHAGVSRRRPGGVGLDGFLDRERSRRPGPGSGTVPRPRFELAGRGSREPPYVSVDRHGRPAPE